MPIFIFIYIFIIIIIIFSFLFPPSVICLGLIFQILVIFGIGMIWFLAVTPDDPVDLRGEVISGFQEIPYGIWLLLVLVVRPVPAEWPLLQWK